MSTENPPGGQATPNPEALNDAAFAAHDAWVATPNDQTRDAMNAAFKTAREAGVKAKTDNAPPQKYELKAPEGVPQSHVEAVVKYATEHKLSNAAAQKLLDRDAGVIKSTIEGSKQKAPEKYDLKLPQGSKLDAGHIERTSAYAREKGLSNEAAQAILERESAAVTSHVEAQQAALEKAQQGWVESAKADKEIGGDKLPAAAEMSKRVLMTFGDDDMLDFLDTTKFGNHPVVVRFLNRIGLKFGDDVLVKGGQPPPTRKSDAEVLFPTHAANKK